MPQVQLSRLVIGHIQNPITLFSQRILQGIQTLIPRRDRETDKHSRLGSRLVSVVELGHIALANGITKSLEGAGPLRDRHAEHRLAPLTNLCPL